MDGAPGLDGAPGPTGPAGPQGADGLSCWDLDGDGVQDPTSEDTDGDGVVDVDDCRSPSGGAGITKAAIYKVEVTAGAPTRALCNDNDDIVLTGHCNFYVAVGEKMGAIFADDPSQPAGWECFAAGGPTATAVAYCLTVN